MSKEKFDQLRLDYKKAVDKWVDTIRAEEALATSDHSMIAMEKWGAARFTEHDAHTKATEAREAYKDALRDDNDGF
jgi:TRAP-type C4-dicarboxylate transport system substrate-binding protein